MNTYFTLTLNKDSIVRDFTLDHVYLFNQQLAKLKASFGFAGFFFIYKDVKVFLDPFIRENPLELEPVWGLFNSTFLICYAYRSSDSLPHAYRATQRFYQSLNNLDPIYYLPFNWQTKELVFSSAVKSPSTFSDNNLYQAFAVGKSNIFSFVTENADVVYSNPTYAFLDGVRANVPFVVGGNDVRISLTTPNNYVSPFTILIIYADQQVVQVVIETDTAVFGSTQIVLVDTYNNQNYLSTPDDQVPLTYFLPHPYFSNKSRDMVISFAQPGATIFKCFLAETPIIGNSVIFNPELGTNGNYINDLVPISELVKGQISTAGGIINFPSGSYVRRVAERRITDTTDYYNTLIALGPTAPTRWVSTVYTTNLAGALPIPSTTEQGMVTDFNYNNADITNVDFVAIPSTQPFVHVQASIGDFYLATKRIYANYLSDFPYTKSRNWAIAGYPDCAVGFEETATATSFLFTLSYFDGRTDRMNDYTVLTGSYIPLLSYRNPADIKINLRMSGLDTFANGLRTNLINLNHYINMRIPSILTMNFYNIKVTDLETTQIFSLGGLNPILIQSLNFLYCRVSINKQDYEVDPFNVLTGRVETNLIKFSNNNQNLYEPINYFNGVVSLSSWRQLTALTASSKYYYKIIIDSPIISDAASFNVQFCFA